MLALGFSSGLPFLLILGTLAVRLREAGIGVEAIGLFTYLALAYSLKFLWSPIVDAFDVPILSRLVGRRRAWMIACQLLLAVAFVGCGLSDPATALFWTAAFTALAAFGAATQDVVVDGWRIDAAPSEMQGIMAAAYQLGYRIGMLAAGAGALYMAQFVSWSAAYISMAALMLVGIAASILSPNVDRPPDAAAPVRKRFNFAEAVKAPLMDLYARKGAALFPILALVALYRVSDFLAGVMSNPLYVDLGFTKAQIASVAKIYGVWIGIVGAFVGGWCVAKLGIYRTMLLGACGQAISHGLFAWLATQGASVEALVFAISGDNFAQSFSGTVLIAYMSSLTGAGFSATQYALLSSLYALPGKLAAGVSGFAVAAWGYPPFFMMTAAIAVPVLGLCMLVARLPGGGLQNQKQES